MTPCVCFRCDAFFLFAVRKHVSVDKKIKTELVSSDGMKAALQLLIPVVVTSSSHPARCYWLRVYRPTAQWLTSKTVPNTPGSLTDFQRLVGDYFNLSLDSF